MIVTVSDIRATGHCVLGIRAWFDSHDLDFNHFMRHGIDAETLLATNDGLAHRVVGMVKQRTQEASRG